MKVKMKRKKKERGERGKNRGNEQIEDKTKISTKKPEKGKEK